MYIVGIDPGLTGAIAFVGTRNKEAYVFNMPTRIKIAVKAIVKKEVDPVQLCANLKRLLFAHPPSLVLIEKVASRPHQGTASMFSLGDSYGVVRGVLSAFCIEPLFVTPQEWKRYHNLIGQEKDASRELAQKLFPTISLIRKKDHNRAEALLIADYGLHLLNKENV